MFKKKKQKRDLKKEYDQLLLDQVNAAREAVRQAEASETALVDARVNGHLIAAETALKKAKFSYLYQEARRRQARVDRMRYFD
ncbi:DUF2508 family protein [Leuconostocaceae bacterium ESL0958]|nr:DUF2508 family protein [Leuconostocaceae bacterium ESL0958]